MIKSQEALDLAYFANASGMELYASMVMEGSREPGDITISGRRSNNTLGLD